MISQSQTKTSFPVFVLKYNNEIGHITLYTDRFSLKLSQVEWTLDRTLKKVIQCFC